MNFVKFLRTPFFTELLRATASVESISHPHVIDSLAPRTNSASLARYEETKTSNNKENQWLCDCNAKCRLLSVRCQHVIYLVVFIREINSLCFDTNVFLSNSCRTQGAALSAFPFSEAASRGIL